MDVWGAIYLDYWRGERRPYVIERDDGVVITLESAASFFEAPRSDAERRLLDDLDGPVLDLGCGAGSYALYLQDRGVAVTAADLSPGAIRVCRERGCLDARVLDVRDLHLPDAAYGSVIVMGNTLGLHQDPGSLPRFLEALRKTTRHSGRLLCTTRDPLATADPVHLAYHQRNRDRGLPAGMTRIRMRYGMEVDEWVTLWLMATEELEAAMAESGWVLRERASVDALRVESLRGDVRIVAAILTPRTCSTSFGGTMQKPDGAEERAQRAAEDWLTSIDAGSSGGSWARASSTFRAAVTESAWAESLARVQQSLGRPLSRSLATAEYKSELPGAPDGHYVVLTYDTRFERKAHGTETVVPELNEDGEWRVSGYFVK